MDTKSTDKESNVKVKHPAGYNSAYTGKQPLHYDGIPICPRCGDGWPVCAEKDENKVAYFTHAESCATYKWGNLCFKCNQCVSNDAVTTDVLLGNV